MEVDLGTQSVTDGDGGAKSRLALVTASIAAADSFFEDNPSLLLALSNIAFDVALVDAGCLAGHLLADYLLLPQVHFLSYPLASPGGTRKTRLLEATITQRSCGNTVARLRASLHLPPKQETAGLHMLTVVGHSLALHTDPLPPSTVCVGSVVGGTLGSAAEFEREELAAATLLASADSWSSGFVICSLGTWADQASTRLGWDETLVSAFRSVGVPVVWKTTPGSSPEPGMLPCNVRREAWIPQRRCRFADNPPASQESLLARGETPPLFPPSSRVQHRTQRVLVRCPMVAGCFPIPTAGCSSATAAPIPSRRRAQPRCPCCARRCAGISTTTRPSRPGSASVRASIYACAGVALRAHSSAVWA